MVISHSETKKQSLVLIHGWGMSSNVFDLLKIKLQSVFDVSLVDIPGFGSLTGDYPTTYSLDDLAKRIDHTLPKNSIICGWSLGGLIATRIVTLNPNKYSQLGLIASSPCFAERDNWKGIKLAVLTQFEQQLQTNIAKTIDRFLAIQAMGSSTSKEDIKYLRSILKVSPQPDEHVLKSGLCLLESEDLRDELKSIQIPVKGLFGKLDSLVPIKSITTLLEDGAIDDAVIFDKASHAPFISHRQEFADAMTSLLV